MSVGEDKAGEMAADAERTTDRGRLRPPLRPLTVGLAVSALVVGVVLLLFDCSSRFATGHIHPPVSAAPLILIGLAWLTLHPGKGLPPVEFVKRLIAAVAFVMWGIDQMLPPGWMAAVVGDVVIVLFVVDMSLIIRGELAGAVN